MTFLQMNAISLVPGTTASATISVLVQSRDADIQSIRFSEERRPCLFKDELGSLGQGLYPHYSHETCVYECALGKMVSFGCLPWDVPASFVSGETRVCSGSEARRFKEELLAGERGCVNECPDACQADSYDTQVCVTVLKGHIHRLYFIDTILVF